ncbi:MAG TPA: hypothetical protein VMV40_08725 [Acidiferrobacter sp.]|nr:hypothetical protein [Acidiferrobacter sp.]
MKRKARVAGPTGSNGIVAVPISRIFLMLDNPRHGPLENESKVIARLCSEEKILPLARDIAKNGLNPLERFALIPKTPTRKTAAANYYVAEGNRRLCALKLLDDPELAPPELRKSFGKAAEDWTQIKTVSAAVFDDMEDVSLWLERIHAGDQGGLGRIPWTSEQKQQFYGGSKNRAAQALLEYAQTGGIISAEDREGKLTTVQRFVSNAVFREALGLDTSSPDNISRIRPKADFDVLVKRFIRDLVNKEHVHSRMNKEDIVLYGRALRKIPGVTNTSIEPEPLTEAGGKTTKTGRRKKPTQPAKALHVQYEEGIAQALKNLKNPKLASLYYSICSVDLTEHVPLIAIGVWAFFETLTAILGRNDGTSFDAFLSGERLKGYGLTDCKGAPREALQRIHQYGNTTKHHRIAATFDGEQLNNEMTTLKPLIIKCAEQAAKVKG